MIECKLKLFIIKPEVDEYNIVSLIIINSFTSQQNRKLRSIGGHSKLLGTFRGCPFPEQISSYAKYENCSFIQQHIRSFMFVWLCG